MSDCLPRLESVLARYSLDLLNFTEEIHDG